MDPGDGGQDEHEVLGGLCLEAVAELENLWLALEKAAHSHADRASVSGLYTGGANEILWAAKGPRRNPPKEIGLRFRPPEERPLASVTANDRPWQKFAGKWDRCRATWRVATIQADCGQ